MYSFRTLFLHSSLSKKPVTKILRHHPTTSTLFQFSFVGHFSYNSSVCGDTLDPELRDLFQTLPYFVNRVSIESVPRPRLHKYKVENNQWKFPGESHSPIIKGERWWRLDKNVHQHRWKRRSFYLKSDSVRQRPTSCSWSHGTSQVRVLLPTRGGPRHRYTPSP